MSRLQVLGRNNDRSYDANNPQESSEVPSTSDSFPGQSYDYSNIGTGKKDAVSFVLHHFQQQQMLRSQRAEAARLRNSATTQGTEAELDLLHGIDLFLHSVSLLFKS